MSATIHIMPAAEYHSDCCPQPSLSSGIAQLIVNESPLHAWHAHPRLGGGIRDSSRRSEIGSVAHKLALGAGADVVLIQADSYRTNAAKQLREDAINAGKIPVLQEDFAAAEALAKPLAEAAAEYMGAPIKDCLAERVIIWQDDSGGWRRAMPDLMTPDYRRVCDLKTTQASVSPSACARRVYEGMQIQAAFYLRAADALEPAGAGLRRFGFIFAEQSAPHAVSPPIELSEAGLDMGRKQVASACIVFDQCLANGVWPGFGREVMVAEPMPWLLAFETTEEVSA